MKPSDVSLEAHARIVKRDLELLDYPRRDWLPSKKTSSGEPVFDVIVVGAGQGGLATAFGLMRERVTNLLVLDENPLDRAGPWRSFARMRTLRTPKHLTGPDLGIPSLTPRAWYEAQHGPDSWEALRYLPKETWADYLSWYRRTLGIPVRAETRVGALRYSERERAFEVPCQSGANERVLYARRVVLATGIDGSGAWQVPSLVRDALPERYYAHTRDAIDFEALRDKRVAVLGAGASAFDNAAVALEHGAREVRLFFRRPKLVDVNAYRWAEFSGFLKHFSDLADAEKWRFMRQILRMGQLPPADTLARASAHAGFRLQPGTDWNSLRLSDGAILIDTTRGTFEADFLIIGTGCVTDLKLRPELKELEPNIARWADRYVPPEGEEHAELGRHPYLGPHFEFSERLPGSAPFLRHLHNFSFGALLSQGFSGASISGMKYSVPRLVAGITRSLFIEDQGEHYQSLCRFDEKEF